MHKLEPMWWALFSVGGTIAAFALPALIFVNNVAGPLGWLPDAVAYDNVLSLLGNPISKLLLIALLTTTLFHVAHRIATLPADFKLPVPKTLASAVSHLSALALSVVTSHRRPLPLTPPPRHCERSAGNLVVRGQQPPHPYPVILTQAKNPQPSFLTTRLHSALRIPLQNLFPLMGED